MRRRRLGPMMMLVPLLRPLPVMLLFAASVLAPETASASSPARFAAAAQARVGSQRPLLRNDCSGLVMTVLDEVGAPRAGNTTTYWADARRENRVRTGRPQVGDLAFFDRTWDANKNGRVDDELSHIAIVVAVDDDGTVHMIHRGGRAVVPLTLHLEHKDRARLNGRKINSYLRAPGYGPPNGPRLAGQLLRGFARPPLGSTMLAKAGRSNKASSSDVALATTRQRPSSTARTTSGRPASSRSTAAQRSTSQSKKVAKRAKAKSKATSTKAAKRGKSSSKSKSKKAAKRGKSNSKSKSKKVAKRAKSKSKATSTKATKRGKSNSKSKSKKVAKRGKSKSNSKKAAKRAKSKSKSKSKTKTKSKSVGRIGR